MTPLVVTSTNAMVKRLGAKRWLALHRLVYPIAVLGVVHFWMMAKRDVTEPAIYAGILAALLGYRVLHARRERAVRDDSLPSALRGDQSSDPVSSPGPR